MTMATASLERIDANAHWEVSIGYLLFIFL